MRIRKGWIVTEDGELMLAPIMPKVIIEVVNEDAITPTYASEGDSGMDVYATEDVLIRPEETKLMKLGFKLGIPKHPLHDYGYRWEAQVRPRSGASRKTLLRVSNSPGTVDNGYRGEVGVLITNTKSIELVQDREDHKIYIEADHPFDLEGKQDPEAYIDIEDLPSGTYLIRKGERFAQIVFNEVIRPIKLEFGVVDETDRGSGGFGSTGVS